MRILLSLVALFGVIAIADVGLSPSANATVLTTDVHALKIEQARGSRVARTTCWWRNGRRGYGYGRLWYHRPCWWRNGRRICRW